MLVTRKTDYAVRCILYLAQDEDKVANVTEVSKKMHIPKTFTSKIFQRLAKAGLVESVRGMNGGYRLLKKPSEISLLDIMEAIQGISCINVCAVDSRKCKRSAFCTVHPFWVELRRDVNKRLQAQTIDKML